MDARADVPAEVAETHISVLFFVGTRAYKLKKPVRFGFLDFSTAELRRAACVREVELNRRLAPDVYLGVSAVSEPDGDAAAEHLVVMRRMPPARRLATLVRDGDGGVPAQLDAVADLVAVFHERATRGAEIDAAATAPAIRRVWDDSTAELEPFAGELLDPSVLARVTERYRRFLDGRERLFDERRAAGCVVDGHGDLQADDVFCLDDGPRVLDCIEFDDRLRYGDVLADVAFLAMDLERLGAPELAARFVARYEARSGTPDHRPLLHHWIAQRAHVRCKVSCLRWAQEEPDDPARAAVAGQAAALLELCDRHLDAARVRLVLVGGAPGTGKTTLARAIGAARGWTVLRSDELRKEMAGMAPTDRPDEATAAELYDDAGKAAVYEALAGAARPLLQRGESVVLDASWTREWMREPAAAVAAATGAEVVALRCEVAPEVAAARIEARRRGGADASDVTPEVAATLAREADPWPEAVPVDTDAPVADVVDVALGLVGPS